MPLCIDDVQTWHRRYIQATPRGSQIDELYVSVAESGPVSAVHFLLIAARNDCSSKPEHNHDSAHRDAIRLCGEKSSKCHHDGIQWTSLIWPWRCSGAAGRLQACPRSPPTSLHIPHVVLRAERRNAVVTVGSDAIRCCPQCPIRHCRPTRRRATLSKWSLSLLLPRHASTSTIAITSGDHLHLTGHCNGHEDCNSTLYCKLKAV